LACETGSNGSFIELIREGNFEFSFGQYLCLWVDEEHVFGGGALVEFERADGIESNTLKSSCKHNHHE